MKVAADAAFVAVDRAGIFSGFPGISRLHSVGSSINQNAAFMTVITDVVSTSVTRNSIESTDVRTRKVVALVEAFQGAAGKAHICARLASQVTPVAFLNRVFLPVPAPIIRVAGAGSRTVIQTRNSTVVTVGDFTRLGITIFQNRAVAFFNFSLNDAVAAVRFIAAVGVQFTVCTT